jgi:hypothetical protein
VSVSSFVIMWRFRMIHHTPIPDFFEHQAANPDMWICLCNLCVLGVFVGLYFRGNHHGGTENREVATKRLRLAAGAEAFSGSSVE